MKPIYGILTLAVAAAIAGCNSMTTPSARDTEGADSGSYNTASDQSVTPAYPQSSNGTANLPNTNNPALNSGVLNSPNSAYSANPSIPGNSNLGTSANNNGNARSDNGYASNPPAAGDQGINGSNSQNNMSSPNNQRSSAQNSNAAGAINSQSSSAQGSNAAGTPDNQSAANTGNGSVDSMHQTPAEHPQVAGREKQPMAASLSDTDQKFIVGAMAGGKFEVDSSRKALANSNSQQVKTLAQDMIDDHTKANGELANLASRKVDTQGPALTTDQTDKLAALDKLNGQAFDNEYLRQQKQAHQDAITLFQNEASAGDDKDIKDWASATLPTLRNHLDMINALGGTNIGMAQ